MCSSDLKIFKGSFDGQGFTIKGMHIRGKYKPKEFMEELSRNYELSIDPVEVEYLLDLPAGTLSSSKIIDIASLQLKQR